MKNSELADQVAEFLLTREDDALFRLNVSSLARVFHMDRSYLSREFKASRNCTLFRFIQNEKMVRAASLLSNSSKLKLERLSKAMGFCTSEYFREVFKKHFGVVPSKYREYKTNLKKNNLFMLILIGSQNASLFHDLSLMHVIANHLI
ncbi:MAG TPA: helix-turn-helix transcriptional regulator [Candidatus Deferrimicrobium sp.]|nr:helix-turn-helix transcriptional regulator [Candidatus Kapabacteria bacterium]HLP61456.1 helix-turn-helix transcriptional regulator [Candidatus Deferrimicrobium sp.]